MVALRQTRLRIEQEGQLALSGLEDLCGRVALSAIRGQPALDEDIAHERVPPVGRHAMLGGKPAVLDWLDFGHPTRMALSAAILYRDAAHGRSATEGSRRGLQTLESR